MRPPTFFSVVLKNIRYRPARYIILALCVGGAVSVLFDAELAAEARVKRVRQGLSRLGADLVAVPRGLDGKTLTSYRNGDPVPFYMAAGVEQRVRAFPFVEQATTQTYFMPISGGSCCSRWDVSLVGYNPETDFVIQPWLTNHRELPGPDEVLAGAAVTALLPGETITFYDHEFYLSRILDKTGSGLDRAIFIPKDAVAELARKSPKLAAMIGGDRISAVLIRLGPGITRERATYELERGIKEITIVQPAKIVRQVREELGSMLDALQTTGYSLWPITAVLIGLVFALSANQRQRELGLLRAIGATPGFIFRMLIAEAVLPTLLGTALGVAVPLVLAALRADGWLASGSLVPIDVIVPVLAAFGLAALTGVLSALAPALYLAVKEPYAAIRGGE